MRIVELPKYFQNWVKMHPKESHRGDTNWEFPATLISDHRLIAEGLVILRTADAFCGLVEVSFLPTNDQHSRPPFPNAKLRISSGVEFQCRFIEVFMNHIRLTFDHPNLNLDSLQ